MTEKEIVVSFSGGRSSAMMCWILENHPDYKDRKKHYVFANTGREMPETIRFVRDVGWLFDIKIHYVEALVFHGERKSSGFKLIERWDDLSTDGEPFEQVIEKYGLPNVSFPHCTRELKINPIDAFVKVYLGLKRGEFVKAIGMRYDEPRRIAQAPNLIYPLYDKEITKQSVNEFWRNPERAAWDLQLEEFEGNCDFCFKKSWSKLKLMAKKHPRNILWWNNMERKYHEPGSDFYRGHKLSLGIIGDIHNDEKDLNCACSWD